MPEDKPEHPFPREPLTSIMLSWRLILLMILVGFIVSAGCSMLVKRLLS